MWLDHTIVPVTDARTSANLLAAILDLATPVDAGPFVQARVGEHTTLDFVSTDRREPHHYAFRLSAPELDAALARLVAMAVPYGSGPASGWDSRCYEENGDRGVYFRDPSGHVYELITKLAVSGT